MSNETNNGDNKSTSEPYPLLKHTAMNAPNDSSPPPARSKRFRKRYLLPLIFIFAIVTAWAMAPTILVWSLGYAEPKGEEPSRRACDRIVYFGERAIPAVIGGIESHSPWARRYVYLPIALKEIGGSAHSQLLDAIDQQQDPRSRAHLISALLCAFDDLSRFHIILDDAKQGRLSDWAVYHLADDVRHLLPDAPPLQTEDKKLNPQFLTYWEARD